MRKAQGWAPIKQFAHKPKVRRSATRIVNLQVDQSLQLSPWGQVASFKRPRLNRERCEEINWKGFIAQPVVDSRPRLRLGRRHSVRIGTGQDGDV